MAAMAAETILAPEQHWLLTGVPAEVLGPALAAGHERRYGVGEVLLREGDGPDGLYLVLDGAVRITATSEHGEAFLSLVKPNEILGEMGVLDGEPRSGTATAMLPTAAFFIPTEPFLDLLERSSLVSNRLLIILSGRLRVMNRRLMEVAPPGPVGRRITPIAP